MFFLEIKNIFLSFKLYALYVWIIYRMKIELAACRNFWKEKQENWVTLGNPLKKLIVP